MRRLHLLELEDQDWFPAPVRDSVTDSLATAQRLIRAARLAAPHVRRLLEVTGEHRVVDVCSGGGGPLAELARELTSQGDDGLRFTLTDKFPNLAAFRALAERSGGAIDFVPESVDATDVSPSLRGVRTQFASFHHFEPAAARRILADCVRKRQAVGVFEYTARDPATMLAIACIPLGQLLAAPFQRPWRWSRLWLTYALPLVPFTLFFDGMVSCLRTYDAEELRELTADLGGDDWCWEIGVERLPWTPVKMSYLLGYPRPAR
jgi:hypothetical protein